MSDIELPKKAGIISLPGEDIIEAQELQLDSENTGSPLSDWVKIRQNDFGETIKPKQLYVVGKKGTPHTVAWLHRSGVDPKTGRPYSFYHVACDCIAEAELREEPEMMLSCEGLGNAIVRRAKETRDFYGLPAILPADPAEEMDSDGEEIVKGTMLNILERDQFHPEAWVANYFNGRHELPILSVVFNRDMEELAEYAFLLQAEGRLAVDNDTTVRLPQAA